MEALQKILKCIFDSGGAATGIPDIDATVATIMGGGDPGGPATTNLLTIPVGDFYADGAFDAQTLAACLGKDSGTITAQTELGSLV